MDPTQSTAPWKLNAYRRVLDGRRGCDAVDGHPTPALNWLATLACLRAGLIVGAGREYLLETRLQPLLRRDALPDLDALVDRLRQPAADALIQEVIEAMTTNETQFFRDAKPFAHLAAHGLPAVAAARRGGEPIRVWSAGASTGQEAYSVAITAADTLGERSVRILGTDIAAGPAARAKAGVYTQQEVQRGLGARALLRHFDRVDNGWQVRAPLRAMCEFGVGNLLHDPAPLGQFDIIMCRNVLIYFNDGTKGVVLGALARQLTPGGLLYLGTAETAEDFCPALERCVDGQPIYRRAA